MKTHTIKNIKGASLLSLFTSVVLVSCSSLADSKQMEEHPHEHTHAPIKQRALPTNNHAHDQAVAHKAQGSHSHEHEDTSHPEAQAHSDVIELSADKMALANIKVSTVRARTLTRSEYAPGEIKANGYSSYIVSPRTESVVVSRHALLGEHVSQGQPLVTLFSESMAEAQAQYRVAYSEWQRIKKLKQGTVSESQILASETDYISAYGRLKAFGLTKEAIKDIVNNPLPSLGEYTLVAQRSGVVLSDSFSQGQRLAVGEKVMVLADESDLWVEARVSPNKHLHLPVGTPATIAFSGNYYQAKVIQEAHTIDEKTRTRIIRLSVENSQDSLHSGMFVDVNFLLDTQVPVIAVPESALMRSSDGDWNVFIESDVGEFSSLEVVRGQALGGYREIIGLPEGSRVVTQGAFFIASEIAKGGFDPHNH